MAAPANIVSQQGLGSVSGDQLNTYVQWTNGVAQLRGVTGLPGMEVTIPGMSAAGDGGYGTFYWSPGSYTDDGVSTIVPSAAAFPFGGSSGAWLRLVNGLTNGGTGQQSAPAARGKRGLNIDELTVVASVDYQILPTDRTVAHSAVSAPLVDTLPLAASVNPGQQLVIEDIYGVASAVDTITIDAAGTDKINGASSIVIAQAYGGYTLISDGVSAWSYEASAGGGTVTSVSGAGSIVGTVTTSGSLNGQTYVCHGRLTLVSGARVMINTVSGATSVYFTPYNGNLVPVWNGTNFIDTIFSEVSQATNDSTKSPAAVGASSIYDIFGWDDAGTFRATRGPAWTSSSARGTGSGTTQLTRVQGVFVNQYSIVNGPAAGFGTYLGTIQSNGSSTIDFIFGAGGVGGVAGSLNVWNMFNRVLVSTTVTDTYTPYAFTSASWQEANNSAGNRVGYVLGLAEDGIAASYSSCALCAIGGAAGRVAIGYSSTTSPYGLVAKFASGAGSNSTNLSPGVSVAVQPTLGFSFIAALEYGGTGVTFNESSSNSLSVTLSM